MTKRHLFVPVAYFLLNFSLLAAQNWTEMSDPVRPYVTRLTDGNGLSCGLATQEEMVRIREAIDRITSRTTPSVKYALAPPAANISVNYNGFTPEAQAAFQRAVDIWSSLLIATVPIEIEATFDSLEDSDTLAAARPGSFFQGELENGSLVAVPVALAQSDRGPRPGPRRSRHFSDYVQFQRLVLRIGRPTWRGSIRFRFGCPCMRSGTPWDLLTASRSTNQPRKPSMDLATTTFRRSSIFISSIQRSTG